MKSLILAFAALVCFGCSAQKNTNKEVLNATSSFLETLSAEQKKRPFSRWKVKNEPTGFIPPYPEKALTTAN
ncbi:hypothetical protein [Jiulongibacter sediminis]|uniref:hypothetical protein n=1 Tax=Jiulongibacter sediminis TaxID=1605367 RepID=UPI00103B457A|nr:hypothetical protein [Jiulongibacter sediminis]